MAAGWEVLQSLVQSGMNADQIRALAQRMTGERQRLLQLGYPESYVAQLSPQQVLNTQGLPLLTGGNELNRDLQARQVAEGALGNRANAGTGLLNTLLAIEQEARAQQASPFRYGEFLADVSGVVPGSAGAPIQALIEKGNYIDPRPSSIMQNSRVQQLLDSLFDYSSPKTFQTEERTDPNIGRVRDAYAKSPTDADRFFEEATRNPEGVKRMFGGAFAHGGELTTDEPVVGMGMASGRPRFLVGEAGPEKLEITPTGRGQGRNRLARMSKTMRTRTGVDAPPPKGALPRRTGMELPEPPAGFEPLRLFAHGGTVNTRSKMARLGDVLGKAMQERRARAPGTRAAADVQARKASALEGIDPNTRLDNASGVVIDGVRYTSGGSGGQTAGDVAARYRKNSGRMLRDVESVERSSFGLPKNERVAKLWAQAAERNRLGGGRSRTTTQNDGGAGWNRREPVNHTDQAAPPAVNAAVRERLAQDFYAALRNNPFVHPDVLARLQANQLPLPGSLSGRTLQYMDQNIRNGLLTALPMAFGISPESYAQEIQRFAIPGANLYVGR